MLVKSMRNIKIPHLEKELLWKWSKENCYPTNILYKHVFVRSLFHSPTYAHPPGIVVIHSPIFYLDIHNTSIYRDVDGITVNAN